MHPYYGTAIEAAVRNIVRAELGLAYTATTMSPPSVHIAEVSGAVALREKVIAIAREVAREELASIVGWLLEELESHETAELRSKLAELLPMLGRDDSTGPGQ